MNSEFNKLIVCRHCVIVQKLFGRDRIQQLMQKKEQSEFFQVSQGWERSRAILYWSKVFGLRNDSEYVMRK